METWRAAVPRSRWWTDANTVSRLRRSVVQEIGKRWQPAVATMIDGDLEGCGPSQLQVDRWHQTCRAAERTQDEKTRDLT